MDRRAAIEALYRETGHLVLRRCVRVLRRPEEAMDATQWTYLKAIESDFEVRSRPEALAWLYTTATRRCLALLRTSSTRSRLLDRYADDLVGMPTTPIDVDAISRDLVRRALAHLDEADGELVVMTWGMGLTNERAAELRGVSTRTVGRARAAFEGALRDLGAMEGA